MMSSPASYPCGACQKNVGEKDKALQCEGTCSQWFHCTCIFGYELSTTQYRKIEASADAWCVQIVAAIKLSLTSVRNLPLMFFTSISKKTFQRQN